MDKQEEKKESVEDSSNKEVVFLVKGVMEEFKVLEEGRRLMKREGQRKMPLWLFMVILLKVDTNNVCVQWTKKEEYEFQVEKGKMLGDVWGALKHNKSMTYAKLSRALRYYYGKNVIEKVLEKPYTYRFVASDKTKIYLPKMNNNNNVDKTSLSTKDSGIDEIQQRPKSLPESFQYRSREKRLRNERRHVRRSCPPNSYLRSDSADSDIIFDSRPRARSYHSDMQHLNLVVKQEELSNDIWMDDFDLSIEDVSLGNEDWKSDFFLRRSTKPADIPLTSCFTVADIPLLNFEDVKSLDDDVWSSSTSCSYASPRSSEPSIDIDTSYHSGHWSSRWNGNCTDNKRRNDSSDMDFESSSGDLDNTESSSQATKGNSVIDMEIEMELVQEYINENSNI